MAFSLRERPWEISEIYSDDRTQCDEEKEPLSSFFFSRVYRLQKRILRTNNTNMKIILWTKKFIVR